MKIAIATQDMTRIDAHFGWAKHFAVYDVSPEGYRFLQIHHFDGDLQPDGKSGKLQPKIQALQGCTLVFVAAIGVEGMAKCAQAKVEPIQSFAGKSIEEALTSLQDTLRRNTSKWLRRPLQEERRGEEG